MARSRNALQRFGSSLRGRLKYQRQLRLEPLEQRQLLSVSALSYLTYEDLAAMQLADTVSATAAPTDSSFSLLNVDGQCYVTSVKNQGNEGTCWAQATCASIESALLVEGGPYVDLSENDLKENHGFDWGPDDGGNSTISEAYLARGGIYLEADSPYVDYDTISDVSAFYPEYYVQEMLKFNTQEEIKYALVNYGALGTTMWWDYDCYSDGNYYYSGTSEPEGTQWHDVTIVGWDDNKEIEGVTGAWLIKNSWGADWGNDGYFWLAYYDTIA